MEKQSPLRWLSPFWKRTKQFRLFLSTKIIGVFTFGVSRAVDPLPRPYTTHGRGQPKQTPSCEVKAPQLCMTERCQKSEDRLGLSKTQVSLKDIFWHEQLRTCPHDPR
jgi:hypothetical protein